jgi:hypothetical protein
VRDRFPAKLARVPIFTLRSLSYGHDSAHLEPAKAMLVSDDEITGHSLQWRKSPASGSSNCVEVAADRETVLVRDTKDRGGPMLSFTKDEWSAFLVGVADGAFSFERLSADSRNVV